MPRPTPNALRWDGRPGHYEVYYLTLTDEASGVGVWIRWRLEAIAGARRLIVEVDAERDRLAGVTYHDPDGEAAYCYNTETASIRLHLYERAPRVGGWAHAAALSARGRAHFEYAQREPVPDQELHLR